MTIRHSKDSLSGLREFYTPSLFSEFAFVSLRLIQRQICSGPIFDYCYLWAVFLLSYWTLIYFCGPCFGFHYCTSAGWVSFVSRIHLLKFDLFTLSQDLSQQLFWILADFLGLIQHRFCLIFEHHFWYFSCSFWYITFVWNDGYPCCQICVLDWTCDKFRLNAYCFSHRSCIFRS